MITWNKTAILSRAWPAYYGLATAAESFRLVTLCSARYERGQSTAPLCFTDEEQFGWAIHQEEKGRATSTLGRKSKRSL